MDSWSHDNDAKDHASEHAAGEGPQKPLALHLGRACRVQRCGGILRRLAQLRVD
jgi:hypothetical protein